MTLTKQQREALRELAEWQGNYPLDRKRKTMMELRTLEFVNAEIRPVEEYLEWTWQITQAGRDILARLKDETTPA